MRSKFYESYMRSEAWKEKKRQRFKVDGERCVMCGRPADKTKTGLQMHHVTYERLGNEDIYQDLVTLCAPCHIKIHRFLNRTRSEKDEYREHRKDQGED